LNYDLTWDSRVTMPENSIENHAWSWRLFELCLLAGIVLIPVQQAPFLPNYARLGITAADLLFALAGALWIAHALRCELSRVIKSVAPWDWAWLSVFSLGVCASAMVNGGSYLKLLGHLELVAIALMVAHLACQEDGRDRVLLALIGAALVGATTGLTGAALFYCGEPSFLLNHYGDLEPGNYPRIRGTAIRANMLATIIATGIAITWTIRAQWRYRVAYLTRPVLAILLLALFFTFSRTWLTLACGLLWFWAARGATSRTYAAAGVTVLVISLHVALARWNIVVNPTRFWEASIPGDAGTRWVMWGNAAESIKAHPLFGRGPGSAATAKGWSAHLTWLNLWAVLGIAPLLAFATGMARCLAHHRNSLAAALALGIMLLDSTSRDIEDMRHLWVLVGILIAATSAIPETPKAAH
jgi:hypothetical protein